MHTRTNPILVTAAVASPMVMVAPRRMSITEAIRDDHNRARELVDQINASPINRARDYPKLADLLKRHSKAEEQTLYVALNQYPELHGVVQRSAAQHHALDAMLKRLNTTAYTHPVWQPRFAQAVRALANHLATEETQVFADAQRLPQGEQARLGLQYQRLMQAYKQASAPVRVRAVQVQARPVQARPVQARKVYGIKRRAPSVVLTPMMARRQNPEPQTLWGEIVSVVFPGI